MITKFFSGRTNLTILQCILYLLIGHIMGSYLEWGQLIIMFTIILAVQFITHIKAVADGMLYIQLMNDNKDFKKFIKKINKNKLGE